MLQTGILYRMCAQLLQGYSHFCAKFLEEIQYGMTIQCAHVY